MNLEEKEVIEARLASNGYRSSSLEAAIGNSEDGETTLADFIGNDDSALELVEDFHALAPMIERPRRALAQDPALEVRRRSAPGPDR